MSLQVPADEDLLRIYGVGTGGMDRTSYDGWAALWLDGYRAGALVRPNVETPRDLNVHEAWENYGQVNPTPKEYEAFTVGYTYGKHADIRGRRIPGWVVPVGIAFGVACFTVGMIAGAWF